MSIFHRCMRCLKETRLHNVTEFTQTDAQAQDICMACRIELLSAMERWSSEVERAWLNNEVPDARADCNAHLIEEMCETGEHPFKAWSPRPPLNRPG